MSIEIAILLRRVLEIPYYHVAEVRILYNHNLKDHAYLGREYSIELKKVGQTLYFEDEEAVLHHLEEVLINK